MTRIGRSIRPENSLHALNTLNLEIDSPGAGSRTLPVHPAAPLWLAGGRFLPWARTFIRNRRRIKWKCLPALALTAPLSALASGLGIIQETVYGRRVARTPVTGPIFIIGHWRTGTTFLHNLLALDEHHAAPSGYECSCPTHFLLTERWMLRILDWLPEFHRPMDDMPISPRTPQEDEFALSVLGQPSPYWYFTFPNHSMPDPAFYDLDALPAPAREAWKKTLFRFLQQVTWLHGKRLVLKSPAHSLRIPWLLQLFPDARFVHIVRNPYKVVPSTIKLDKALVRLWAVHETTDAALEEQVFKRGAFLYEKLEAGKQFISPDRFHELRYEDLVRDPIGQLSQLYTKLSLGGFARMRPKLEQHLAEIAGYTPAKYELDPRLRDEITRHWGAIIQRYGYSSA